MPDSLHPTATSCTADIAAFGEDSWLSVFTFMPPVTRTIVSRPEALVTCTRICFAAKPGTAVQPLSRFVVVNWNDSGVTTVCWNHDLGCVCLQRASGHVLDEISVRRKVCSGTLLPRPCAGHGNRTARFPPRGRPRARWSNPLVGQAV